MTLNKQSEDGSLKPVDKWTEEVRMGADYYNFIEHFLFPVMSLMALVIPRLSVASQLYLSFSIISC